MTNDTIKITDTTMMNMGKKNTAQQQLATPSTTSSMAQQHFYASVDDAHHLLHSQPPILEHQHPSLEVSDASYMNHSILSSSASDLPVGDLASFVPTLGQRFGSFQEIETLLDAFARANSFMIIIMRSQRPGGHVVQATFGCYKSGSYRPNKADTPNKRTIKTNCPFQINVRYSEKTGEYRITKVDLEHNHELDMADVRTNIVKKAVKRATNIEEGDMGDGEKTPRKKKSKKIGKPDDGSVDASGATTPYADTHSHEHPGDEFSLHMLNDPHHGHSGFHDQHGPGNNFLFEELGLPENIVKDVHDAMQFIGL